ncbi:MAG: flagellin [Clostridiales Family XIII bacterium]|jgi:flagellin|nr:flagellin [Clostridiales Family XIII bacterium]
MALEINHNISALNAYNQHTINQGNSALSLRKLSSGLKINTAADSAALLAISEKMRSQTRGLSQSISNAGNGRNLVQTAEGAMNQTHSLLQRMRDLAVQAANGTNTPFDRQQLQGEASQLIGEINRVSRDTEFNTLKLLNGTFEKNFATDVDSLYGAEVQVNPDSGFEAGDYNVKLSGADATTAQASVTDNSNVISSGTFTQNDIHVQDGASFGTYTLQIADAGGGTYTGTLTNPAGEAAGSATFSIGGGSGNSPATVANFGDLQLDFGDATSLTAGSLDINVSGNLRFELTNTATGDTTDYAVSNYAGGTIDLGGLELTGGIKAQADNATGENIRVDSTGEALTLHMGANQGQNVQVSLVDASSVALGVNKVNLTTQEGADAAIGVIDEAIGKISTARSRMGAVTNRMDHTIRSLSTTEENMTASESRIRDADMAKEILDYTRNTILAQASISIMAQSKLMPQSILRLLQ